MPSPPATPPDAAAASPSREADGGAALASVLGYQLAQASVATTTVFMRQVGEPFDLRPVEYTILALVHGNPGLSSARLAQMLSVTAPNITVWIDRLVRRGWVERQPSATDRRERQLHATADGAGLVEQATRRLVDGEREAFGHLSVGERAILIELLRKLPQRPA